MLTSYQKQAKMKLITTTITLIVIAGIISVTDIIKPKTGSTSTTLTTSAPASTPSSMTPATNSTSNSNTISSGYKDGAYSATASYYVPHGNESIQVSLTLSNGVITNVSTQNSENDQISAQYQESFASVYKSSVVGKKISGLQLSIIGGASDTTQGFDDALSKIILKAQA